MSVLIIFIPIIIISWLFLGFLTLMVSVLTENDSGITLEELAYKNNLEKDDIYCFLFVILAWPLTIILLLNDWGILDKIVDVITFPFRKITNTFKNTLFPIPNPFKVFRKKIKTKKNIG